MLSLLLTAYCLFNPPPDWEIADPNIPSRRVSVGFVDQSKSGFCPSMNLTHEKITVSLKEYLSIVQKNCLTKKQKCRILGTMKTQSGNAELIEVEAPSKFGPIRLLQAILPHRDEVFILTAAALKKDFAKYAKKFETAFCSLSLCEDLFNLAEQDADALRKAWQKKQQGIKSNEFEEKVFEHKELGPVWQLYMSSL